MVQYCCSRAVLTSISDGYLIKICPQAVNMLAVALCQHFSTVRALIIRCCQKRPRFLPYHFQSDLINGVVNSFNGDGQLYRRLSMTDDASAGRIMVAVGF